MVDVEGDSLEDAIGKLDDRSGKNSFNNKKIQ